MSIHTTILKKPVPFARNIIAFCVITGIVGIAAVALYLSWFVSPSLSYSSKVVYRWASSHGSGSVALPGKSNWLFYRPAFFTLIKPWPKKNVETIILMNNKLLRDGIRLLVVPVPDKNEVYPELAELGNPRIISNQRTRFIQQLSKSGVAVVDLLPVFKSAEKSKYLYFKQDSHWNMNGLALAAKEISTRLSLLAPSLSHSLILNTLDTNIPCNNDLWTLLHKSDTLNINDECTWKQVVDQEGIPFESDAGAPVWVFGDSFIHIGSSVHANLFAQIARNSGFKTRNCFSFLAFEQAPSILFAYLKNAKQNPRIIVWVFISCKLDRDIVNPVP